MPCFLYPISKVMGFKKQKIFYKIPIATCKCVCFKEIIMLIQLLKEYRNLLIEKRECILSLDGERLEEINKKEELILENIKKALEMGETLNKNYGSFVNELYSLHKEISDILLEVKEIFNIKEDK